MVCHERKNETKSNDDLRGVIGLVLLSFFWGRKPRKSREELLSTRLTQAVGEVAAEEASKLLGERGGDVVLLLTAQNERDLAASGAGVKEESFRTAILGHPSVQLAGHYLVWFPLIEEGVLHERPTLKVLQAIRAKFPSASLIVSLSGLPKLDPEDLTAW